MLSYLLQNSELSQLFKFLSPNWLQVTSPVAMLKLVKRLKTNHSDQEGWERVRKLCSDNLQRLGLEIAGKQNSPTASLSALRIFFAQVLHQGHWILDLRGSGFTGKVGGWTWAPKNYFYEISPEFLEGIRGLYRGFYRNDDGLFEQSLAKLGLSAAKASLLKHFGSGDQSQVRFQLATFQATFAEVFDSCAREKIKLQPDFFILGLMLLGLYENLEQSGEVFDVRAVFLAEDGL